MSNYDLNRHKRGDKIKWIISGVAMVLAFVLIVGLFLQVFGQGKVKPSEWFKQYEAEESEIPETNENGGATLSVGESNGMLLAATAIPLNSYEEYGVSALAENAYNLNVTYTPADTTFQETTYTMAFADDTDCSAYATLTQTAVGSKTATFSILKPFSKQIIITATCDRNTAIKATTTVDYVCTTLNIDVVSEHFDISDDIYFIYRGWSNGTITPETDETITFVYDVGSDFVSQAAAAGFTVNRYYTSVLSISDEDLDICCSSLYWIYLGGIIDYNSLSSTEKADYTQFLGQCFAKLDDGDSCGMYGFSYKRIYNGVTYSTYDIMQDSNAEWFDFDRGTNWSDSFEVVATSMSTNTSSIVAG